MYHNMKSSDLHHWIHKQDRAAVAQEVEWLSNIWKVTPSLSVVSVAKTVRPPCFLCVLH